MEARDHPRNLADAIERGEHGFGPAVAEEKDEAMSPIICTPGEREVLSIALRALRKARRHKGAVTMSLVFDPWLPKGMRGATITVSLDTTCERYEIDDLGKVGK